MPAIQETWIGFLGWEELLKQEMAIHSRMGNPMDRGARQATVHGVTKEWDMTYRLNNYDTLWLLLSITVAIGNKNSLLHMNLYELCLEDLREKKR